jgi:GTP-binding protein HflX
MKPESTSTAPVISYAVLIGVINKKQNEDLAKEYLEELAFLAETYGVETKKTFTQKLEKPDKATFIGKGKLSDVKPL